MFMGILLFLFFAVSTSCEPAAISSLDGPPHGILTPSFSGVICISSTLQSRAVELKSKSSYR